MARHYTEAPPALRALIEANGFWRPWQPNVGDMVRLRVAQESLRTCPKCQGITGHTELDGQIGVVIDIDLPHDLMVRCGKCGWSMLVIPGHTIGVAFGDVTVAAASCQLTPEEAHAS
jgi:hypothetical protein